MEKNRGYEVHSSPLNTTSGLIQWDQCGHLLSKWATALSIETGGIKRVTENDRREMNTHVWNACTFWSVLVIPQFISLEQLLRTNGITNDYFLSILFWVLGKSARRGFQHAFNNWLECSELDIWSVLPCGCDARDCACLGRRNHYHDSRMADMYPWCVVAGTGAHEFNVDAHHTPSGADGIASVLSFLAVVFSFAVSWINCAADYNIRMPLGTRQSHIFLLTYIGIAAPTILVQSLGAALMSQSNPSWSQAYQKYGVGGPLAKALEPAGGFGKLLMMVATLSSIPVG
nr:purine-cytosine permease fcyb [Quercus suber]